MSNTTQDTEAANEAAQFEAPVVEMLEAAQSIIEKVRSVRAEADELEKQLEAVKRLPFDTDQVHNRINTERYVQSVLSAIWNADYWLASERNPPPTPSRPYGV